MTETSSPFSANNSLGGSQTISETQWQDMGTMWGGDRAVFSLEKLNYAAAELPFQSKIVGRTVTVGPGKAWVGGFLYQNSATITLPIADNPTSDDRIDSVVVRLDMSKSSAVLAILPGVAAATPVAPKATRTPGGVWEMILHDINVPAQNGPLVANFAVPYRLPSNISAPWNIERTIQKTPVGTFGVDLDNNASGINQVEYYNSPTGVIATRNLGKALTYTPAWVDANDLIAPNTRTGYWRYIAPNTISFSIRVTVDQGGNMIVAKTGSPIGLTLPRPVYDLTGAVFTGVMFNPGGAGSTDYPNIIQLTAFAASGGGSNVIRLYWPNSKILAEGLDGVSRVPGNASITITGVYESDVFAGRTMGSA